MDVDKPKIECINEIRKLDFQEEFIGRARDELRIYKKIKQKLEHILWLLNKSQN